MKAKHFHPQPNTHGLVTHLKLWTGFSGNAKVVDYSPWGNDGVVVGAKPAYPGFSFDGTDDYIGIATPSNLPTGTTPRTTSIWVKTIYTGAAQILITWGANAAGDIWKQFIDVTSGNHWLFVNGGNARGTVDIRDGKWHHLIIACDGIAVENSIFYLDGEIDVISGIGAEPLTTTEELFFIGVANDGSTTPFNGFLDDVRIYNRALSAAEVKTLYDLTRWRYAA